MNTLPLRLVYAPSFESMTDLVEVFFKAAWMMFPFVGRLESVIFPVAGALAGRIEEVRETLRFSPELPPEFPDFLDPEIRTLPREVFSKLNIVDASRTDALNLLLASASAVFVWRSGIDDTSSLQHHQAGGRVALVDKHVVSHEAWVYHRYFQQIDGEFEQIIHHSVERFAQLRVKLKRRGVCKAYVFGTGPSVSRAHEMDFSDGVTIVSNGIVLNEALMARIRPDVITAIDPLYHSGPSRYAGEFRRKLGDALERYGSRFITRAEFYRWFADYYPRRMEEQIIGIPILDDAAPPEPPLYFRNKNGNVLLASMLPIAMLLAQEVNILGCDGRPTRTNACGPAKEQEKVRFFWRHDRASQIDNWEELMYAAAPAYFNSRDFDHYFQTHAQRTAQAIASATAKGWTVRCLTPSSIPALAELYEREHSQETVAR